MMTLDQPVLSTPHPTKKVATQVFDSVIAVDPGASGGFAAWRFNGILAEPTNHDERVAIVQFEDLVDQAPAPVFVLERVHASPVMGVSAAFAFGTSYGFWRGVLTRYARDGFQVFEVTPQCWQRPWADRLQGLVGGPRKSELRRIALELHPQAKPTLATADAILMAHYFRDCMATGRNHGGTPLFG